MFRVAETQLVWTDVATGFALSLLGGAVMAHAVLYALRKWLRLPSENELHGGQYRRVPSWVTGVVERLFFTTAVAYDLSGAAVAMIGWITLKLAINWNRAFRSDQDQHSPPRVQRAFAAMLAGMASMWLAVLGGLVAKGSLF